MLGEALLVAPVFNFTGVVNYYLPTGRWTNLLNGNVVEGGRWVREKHDFKSLPLMVRPNSLIAIGNQDDRPDYDYAEGVTLQVYELEDGKSAIAEIPSLSGEIQTTFSVQRAGHMIQVERKGKRKAWKLLLAGIPAIASVVGGTAETSPQGVMLTCQDETDSLQILLP
jgi:alpha-D-xyloside xylohydrolase